MPAAIRPADLPPAPGGVVAEDSALIFDNGDGVWQATPAQILESAVTTVLAPDTGATKIGADDDAGGTLWGTVAEFIGYARSDDGASVVGYRSRSVGMKLDDWCTPLDFGAVGDGVTLDTAAIDAALATGKHVVFPKSYEFLTDTTYGHTIGTNGQIVEINGQITYNGTDHTIPGSTHGFLALLRGGDQVERIQIIGRGTLNGARPAIVTANSKGSGILLERNPQAIIDGIRIEEFVEDGIYALNCAEIDIRSGVHFYRTRSLGVEIKSYLANPLPAGVTWTGTTYAPSGRVYGTYEYIDDGQHYANNGAAVLIAAENGALGCRDFTVGGRFLDCLAGIQAEQNYEPLIGLHFDNPFIRGNIRGAATVECSDGISMNQCYNVTG